MRQSPAKICSFLEILQNVTLRQMKQCTISIFSMQISVVKLTYTKRRNASLGSNPQARKETGEFGIGSSFCHSPNPPQGHGNIIQYKFLESFSGDLILKNLILRTRSFGTGFSTANPTWGDIFNALSKLKAQSWTSLFTETWQKRRSSFELWPKMSPQVDQKKPPPPGGFPIYYVPSSRTVCKRPPRRICTRFYEGVPLIHGSWWGNIVNRKPPGGDWVSFDQSGIGCTQYRWAFHFHSTIMVNCFVPQLYFFNLGVFINC